MCVCVCVFCIILSRERLCDVLIPRLMSSTKCLERVFTKPENRLHWTTQACNETPYKKKEKESKNLRKKIINAVASLSTHMNSLRQ